MRQRRSQAAVALGAGRPDLGSARDTLDRREGREPTAPLFPAASESGFHSVDWVRHETKRLCEAIAMPVVTAHGLRGTHASLARAAGATGHLVAQQLGHSNEKVTRDNYVAPGLDEQEQRRQAFRVLTGGQ